MILGEKLRDHRQILTEDLFFFFLENTFFSDKNKILSGLILVILATFLS